MYILYYIIFVLFALLFENYFISFFLLFIIFPIHYILGKKFNNFHLKHFLYICILFSIPIISINYKYINFHNNSTKCNTICEGTIVDVSSQGKYIVKINESKFTLSSNSNLQIGDLVLIQSNFTNYTTPSKFEFNNFSIKYSGKFDYNKWLYMKSFHGAIISKQVKVIGQGNIPINIKLKKWLKTQIIEVYGEGKYAGLVLGMLIGDKSNISDQDYEGFIDSSLVHLIAVSGGNVVIIVMFLSLILFFVPYYFRLFCISLVLILYCFVCGLDSSIVRAVIMGVMSYIALFLGREISIKRLITYSIFLMLAINPQYLLYDLGFQLSYMALGGLVLFSNFIKLFHYHKSISDFLNYYLFPTLGANLGVFPLLIIFIGKINIVGILGNLLVLPLVSFVMIYGFVSIYLFQLFHWQPIVILITNLLDYIYSISQLTVDYGMYIQATSIYSKIFLILIYFAILFTLFKIWKIKKNNQTISSD